MSKKAILAVSFGTSYRQTMEKTISSIENKISKEFSDYDIYRAFTSGIIIKKLKSECFDMAGVSEEIHKLLSLGYDECYIQPTHIIAGMEYEKMLNEAKVYENKFNVFKIGKPLLYTTEHINKLIDILVNNIYYDKNEAVVLMGHGSEHFANTVYASLDYMFKEKGYNNFFVGTVEAYPNIETVLRLVKNSGFKKAVILPLLIVAGDHALNDMSSNEPDSWLSVFNNAGISARAVVKGLGEYNGIAEMYIEHIKSYMGL